MQPTFNLDGSTLLTIGGVITTLISAIGLLFKRLIEAKDAQIAAKDAQIVMILTDMKDQRTVMMEQIEQLKVDRNYFRDIALRQQRREPQGGRSNDTASD